MTPKKTPIGARYVQRVNEVNDQLCFAALQQWELERRLAEVIAIRSSDYTHQIFPDNPFAMRIHRQMQDLPRFVNGTKQIALRMGVIAAVEHFLAYLEDVQLFRSKLRPSAVDTILDDAEEEQLRKKIKAWAGSSPPPEYFLTFGYLRLLRNHYAHVNDAPHTSLDTYIRTKGTILNRFWKKRGTALQQLDFKTVATSPLTPEIAFEIINVLRISLVEVDRMVAETCGLQEIVLNVLQDKKQKRLNPQIPRERLSSKVRGRISSDWGWDVSLSEVTRAIAGLR